MTPELSVIIPVYNSAEYISEAIASILNQSYRNFELLIINDGSKDNSGTIIKSYEDSRIRYFENDGNKGMVYSLNRGIDESKGRYIVRMDADDIALPSRLERQFDFMELHLDIGVSGTFAEYIGERTGIWKYDVSHNEIKCHLMWGSSLIHPTAIVRKDILIKNNIRYEEHYHDTADFKLWVNLGRVSKLANLPEVLLKYRVHKDQATIARKKLMDENKTEIIIGQLSITGVNISESDFAILRRFITFEYGFSISELKRLFEIYTDFISKNNFTKEYSPHIINLQISRRLFEASYFSTQQCGINAVRLFKKHFGLNNISFVEKLKFYYKGIKK